MEPLSAIAIASAVVQFVDFSVRLVVDIRKAYKLMTVQSTGDTLDIEQINRDLIELNDEVMSKSHLATSSSEGIFVRLCTTCVNIAKELQDCVEEASVAHQKISDRLFSTVHLKLLKRKAKVELKDIRKRLDRVQQQMVVAALVYLWANSKEKGQSTQTSERMQPHVPTLESLGPLQRSLDTDHSSGSDIHPLTDESTLRMMNAMWAIMRLDPKFPDPAAYFLGPDPDVSWLRDGKDLSRHVTASCLFFKNLGYREGAIDHAHANTFEWIFKSPRSIGNGDTAWSSFPDWLRGTPAGGVYWITGKPGAGKSTLVKFIIEDPRTQAILEEWSGDQPLVVLDFYFWIAGSDLQRSREGLLRTMLFQALNEKPELIPRVFPKRWTLAKLFGHPALDLEWGFEELLQGFRTFLDYSTQEGKVAIFIDGLDEFQGDHSCLVSLVQEISSLSNVKMCVSSRPWNIFRDNFSRGPSIRVEQLTGPDINLYVRDRFSDSAGFRELEALNNAGAKRLVTAIVTKSQGVFLWVTVVVTTLLDGLAEGDRVEELERKLVDLPDELNNLFDVIWHGIRPEYHYETSRYLEMVRATEELDLNLNAFTVWLTDDAYGIGMSTAEVMAIDQEKAVSALSRRLAGRTKGLIEIHRTPNSATSHDAGVVGYMHRTVRDWASTQSTIKHLQSSAAEDGTGWDVKLSLLKGEMLRLAAKQSNIDFSQTEVHWPSSPTVQHEVGRAAERLASFWEEISPLFQIASRVAFTDVTASSFVSILDRIDIELTRVAMITPVRGDGSCQHGYWFFGIHWLSVDPPHWSNIQKIFPDMLRHGTTIVNELRQEDLGVPSDYIVFTSQIPLVHYIRVKIKADPSILHRLIAAYGTCPTDNIRNAVGTRPFRKLFPWQSWLGDKGMCGILRLCFEPGVDLRPIKTMKLRNHEVIKVVKEFEKASPRQSRIRAGFKDRIGLGKW